MQHYFFPLSEKKNLYNYMQFFRPHKRRHARTAQFHTTHTHTHTHTTQNSTELRGPLFKQLFWTYLTGLSALVTEFIHPEPSDA